MGLHFYDVDVNYVKYLQETERIHRGFTKVPNMEYSDKHERKMVCGVVIELNTFKYYVPVSSYKQKQDNNILIILKDDAFNKVKGSLRFNYMFPIDDEYVTVRDFKKEKTQSRKLFLHRQLVYCDSIKDDIYAMAEKTYNDIVNKVDDKLLENSCDFTLLERACASYRTRQEIAFTQENI